MKGDFTRATFQPGKHYSSVRMQQGRVQLDADWNEELDILGHRLQVETIDVIGMCGAPQDDAGFAVLVNDSQLKQFLADSHAPGNIASYLTENKLWPSQRPAGDVIIGPGRYYVDGTLCENDDFVPYVQQPDLPGVALISGAGIYLVYLDVWQRHIIGLDDPEILETALGGPDTATRAKTLWQVKTLRVADAGKTVTCADDFPEWDALIAPSTGMLSARAQPGGAQDNLCIIPAGGGYRRLENQLYRVEIHAAGSDGAATFKWSRDNGSVVTKLTSVVSNTSIQVASIGRDTVQGFASGQWIEVMDDAHDLLGTPGLLASITNVEGTTLTLAVPGAPVNSETLAAFSASDGTPSAGSKVRRWDFADAGGPPTVTTTDFIPLESGVQVKFETGTYNTGDYWLIPARTLGGTVEWPVDPATAEPLPQLAAGITHAYCRLALLQAGAATTTATGGFIRGRINAARFVGAQAAASRQPPAAAAPSNSAAATGGQALTLISDCRNLFPPLTNLPGQTGIPPAMHVTAVALNLPTASTSFVVQPGAVARLLGQLRPEDLARLRQLPAAQQAQFVRDAIQLPPDQQSSLAQRVLAGPAAQPGQTVAVPPANLNDEAQRLAQLASIVGPVVGGVRPPVSGGGGGQQPSALSNDSQVALDAFAQGIIITCDHPVAASSVRRPTCFVTLEVPYFIDLFVYNQPQILFQAGVAGIAAASEQTRAVLERRILFPGYHPYELDGQLTVTGNTIVWQLTQQQRQILAVYLQLLTAAQGVTPMLARLTLKGSAIWADDNPQLHLDGEAFGAVSGSRTALALPSGGGQRGSDFEMWFWLTPPTIRLTISPATVTASGQATGTVSFAYPAPVGTSLALTSSNTQVATVVSPLAVNQGAMSAGFTIATAGAAVGTPAQQVTITATYLGAHATNTLTVNPPQLQ